MLPNDGRLQIKVIQNSVYTKSRTRSVIERFSEL